ncbi:phosphotransferase [Streptomyces sp. NBC_01571]|uniref:phosphotransferase n=1 Tax=Streptomyces sp. NBC_01571 TaxID=2975883 RepID=UPI00224FCA1D|nr:phosphotransferase [Streptomyces sp. NBC_01571]MCX4576309.1 phosphotransferase [Streptomyces sp. NBC_01571]
MPRSSVPIPVIHAPPLGALLRQYAAGSALTCDPVEQGLLNRGYRLRTTHGRYFLKHHFDPETADPAAIARQHRATQRLADLGVPVAPPLAGTDGRTVAVVGGHAYALHPWIDGGHRHGGQLTTAQCARLGALLGVVHASLERVMERVMATQGRSAAKPPTDAGPYRAPEGTPDEAAGTPEGTPDRGQEAPDGAQVTPEGAGDAGPTGDTGNAGGTGNTEARAHEGTDPARGADPADTFALIDRLLARVRSHRPPDAFDELARHRLLERRALLEKHADRRPPQGGSVGWVHGDFHPFNLLYRDGEPAAIVDWDRLGVHPRAEEAVRAAMIFFVRPVGALDLAKVRAYARAYRRAAGAGAAELAAAVHRVWWERLNDFWMLRWHYERGDTRADPQFPAASALAVWWTREYDAVCEAFTG